MEHVTEEQHDIKMCLQCLKEEATMESICADCFWLEDTIYRKRGPILLYKYENTLPSNPLPVDEWQAIVEEWVKLNTERGIERYGTEFVERMKVVYNQLKNVQPS